MLSYHSGIAMAAQQLVRKELSYFAKRPIDIADFATSTELILGTATRDITRPSSTSLLDTE